MKNKKGGWGEFEERDGRNHGSWKTFFADGRPHIDRTFVNGREHGVSREWNESGQLISEVMYQDDVLHGHWKKWDASGKLIDHDEFAFGERLPLPEPEGVHEHLLEPFRRLDSSEAAKFCDRAVSELGQLPIFPVPNDQAGTRERVCSWLGLVTHAPAGESWPTIDGKPMIPLLQLRVDELPFRPASLEGVAFLSVFAPSVYPHKDGMDELVIHVAPALDPLVPLAAPPGLFKRNPASLSWKPGPTEYPDRNDLPPGLRMHLEDHDPNSVLLQGPARETKIGGWPHWIQFDSLRGRGEFVLQIDSSDFPDWDAGDGTVFTCFRECGTASFWICEAMY